MTEPGVGGGGGKWVGTSRTDTAKQSGAGGTLTPADRHGSVQVSGPWPNPLYSPLYPFLFHLSIQKDHISFSLFFSSSFSSFYRMLLFIRSVNFVFIDKH